MTASAVLRIGSHAPVPVYGTPAVSPDYRPGEITIVLGYTCGGLPVALTVSTLEWAGDLENAGLTAYARGIVRSDMHMQAVTP